MKYVYTFLLSLTTLFAGAQCVPSQENTSDLIYPFPDTANQPALIKGQYYEDTITINVPNDTSVTIPIIGTITAVIDSVVLTSITGLPAGMSYGCHNSRCNSLGGGQGCFNYFGSPQEVGIFSVTISGVVYTDATEFPFDEQFPLVVEEASTGITELASNSLLRVYPNPATEIVNIEFPEQTENGSFRIYSVLGNEVHNGILREGVNSISTVDFPAGYYLISASVQGETVSHKLAVIK